MATSKLMSNRRSRRVVGAGRASVSSESTRDPRARDSTGQSERERQKIRPLIVREQSLGDENPDRKAHGESDDAREHHR